MNEYLKKLNNEQYTAATAIDGRVLVLAGAGTGKTATLIARVAYMLDQNISARNILLLTFTNKAAKEMKNRAESLIGSNAKDLVACTFHSFCATFMRRNSQFIDINNNFNIMDSPDTSDIMSIARQEFIERQKKNGIEYKGLKDFPSVKSILSVHEHSVNNCINVDCVISNFHMQAYANEIKEIINIFMAYKHDRNVLDYNDLLLYTKKILETREDIRSRMDKQFKYVLCDEYQDTNAIQNDILDLLTEDYTNLCVVGDDNQSIYAFRCADITNILSFDIRYPNCKTIILKENYRSSQEILDLANSVMEYATEGRKKYLKGQFNGNLPNLVVTDNDSAEAEFVFNKILEYRKAGIPLHSMGVIARSARQTYLLETLLNQFSVPYEKFGGIKFMERASVKDILAFLRISVNLKDEIAWFRLLQLYSGIGKTYAKKISSAIATQGIDVLSTIYNKRNFHLSLLELKTVYEKIQTLNIHDILKYIIEDYYPDTVYKLIQAKNISDIAKADEINNFKEQLDEARLLYSLSEKYKTARQFLADIVLDATVDNKEEDTLNLSTIHSAKGLEYSVVFILDVIEGITPKCDEDSYENPEELRCLYVALTRAKNELYVMIPRNTITVRNSMLSHFINHDDILDNMNNYNDSDLYHLRTKLNYSEWY